MLNYFIYNGQDSRDFGIVVKNKSTYNQARKDNSFVSIPGRSGDIITTQNRLSNVTVHYDLRMFVDYANTADQNLFMRLAIDDLKEWLTANSTYNTLSDSYAGDDYFMYANFSGGIEFSQIDKDAIDFSVDFNCKPLLFSNVGQSKITQTDFSNPFVIVNPDISSSLPYLKIVGDTSCIFGITNLLGNFSFSVSEYSGYVEIDSQTKNCYKKTQNLNGYFSGKFPIFAPGNNTITRISGSITSMDIIGRWCKPI